jgi:hypothetical protein
LGTETDGISDCPNKFYNVFKMILCMGWARCGSG